VGASSFSIQKLKKSLTINWKVAYLKARMSIDVLASGELVSYSMGVALALITSTKVL